MGKYHGLSGTAFLLGDYAQVILSKPEAKKWIAARKKEEKED